MVEWNGTVRWMDEGGDDPGIRHVPRDGSANISLRRRSSSESLPYV